MPAEMTPPAESHAVKRGRRPSTPRPQGSATLPGETGKKISMREVAKLAKVSVATVSMVLNDNPRISRATHMRVQRLIDRLGYRPNRLAQSLSGRYTQLPDDFYVPAAKMPRLATLYRYAKGKAPPSPRRNHVPTTDNSIRVPASSRRFRH